MGDLNFGCRFAAEVVGNQSSLESGLHGLGKPELEIVFLCQLGVSKPEHRHSTRT